MEIDKVEYTKKDLWWVITKTALATFVLAGIFFRFVSVENTQLEVLQGQEDLKALIEDVNNYTNERIDKKTSRNKEFIDENHDEIDKIKQNK